ncbi:hypothetical protein F3Y22_tig00110833pilonHSYRG00051 [Hibiscus syriacus]|uniref:DUF4283 domain-containing protein n=1 Tax=Hibiscus syriacus TaxID=106335 RepID=A0A6A2ZLS6_HIBSY|nr:hypothetical protein F3Y22_tig00110833pilonHSYRG00051 [Hibiscus syriacus]
MENTDEQQTMVVDTTTMEGIETNDGVQDMNGGFDSDNIIVSDEDCMVDDSGLFLKISFSEKVHEQIDISMSNTIIVRLLGRTIGFNTLLSRIHALWKPIGEIQLVDLDINYFLVRFEDERDFANVLTEGPWTISGNYLTVLIGFESREENKEAGSSSSRKKAIEVVPLDAEKNAEVITQHPPPTGAGSSTSGEECKMIIDGDGRVNPDVSNGKILKVIVKDNRLDVVSFFEPQISGSVAGKIISKFGFKSLFKVEVHGFSGDLWLLWKRSTRVDILERSDGSSKSQSGSRGFADFLHDVGLSALGDYDSMTASVTMEEVKNAIFDMGSFKASGVDGLQVGFYQKNWHSGDPLSSYLFVPCMERLAQVITAATNAGKWKPFRTFKQGPGISQFCDVSGHKASLSKTTMPNQLAKAILAAISLYTMQTAVLHKKTCMEIE